MARTGTRPQGEERPPFDEDPQEHARLKRIFLKAVSLADDERERFLDEACEGEARLRREVDSLLSYHFEAVNDRDEPDS